MLSSATLLLSTLIVTASAQSSIYDFIQGYTLSSDFTLQGFNYENFKSPSECLSSCISNNNCGAIAINLPNGFTDDVTDATGSTCHWYTQPIPTKYLIQGPNHPYTKAGGRYEAIINIRFNSQIPSFSDLPESTGTCESTSILSTTSNHCFISCPSGFSSNGAQAGSQCMTCKSGYSTKDNNTSKHCRRAMPM